MKKPRWLPIVILICALGGIAAISMGKMKGPALPDTRPGHLMGDWLKLCGAADAASMATWLTQNLSVEASQRMSVTDRARSDSTFCAANGGVRFVDVLMSDYRAASLLVTGSKSEVWFEMMAETNDAGKIVRGGIWPTAPPESAMPKDLSDAAIVNRVGEIVTRQSRGGMFSGIVSVARGTQVIASAGGGYADRAKKVPFSGSTQFTLGSMGKMFTAASIGQLVDQGKMSFDDTVGKFFPDYPNQAIRDGATVAMLLSHTSGMGDFLDKRTPQMMENGVKRAEEFMPLYDNDEPRFTPGSAWAYSNAGMALAGAIVEKVSGEDYPDYLRKHIFAVAGMSNSDPNNIPSSSAQLVTPYTKRSEQEGTHDWHEAEHDIGSPAGGAISTADDLVRFADALRSGKLVGKATWAEMSKSRGNGPGVGEYGYGMNIESTYGRTMVGHGGGFPGVSTNLHILLDSPYTVVVLANQDPPAEAYVGLMVVALVAEKAKLGK